MIVVSDTSAISNLAAIDQLDLLRQLYTVVIIPSAVYQELLNDDTESIVGAVQSLGWLQTQSVNNLALLEELKANLDEGEAEAIALAVELSADRLIIDERRGRNAALQLGLQITGLLGILLAAKQQKLIPQVQPILSDLVANDFWIREELYAEVLRLAGE